MVSRPDPNRILGAALFGEARALAVGAGSIDEAREVLLQLADGRYDLLAQEAGLMAASGRRRWPGSIRCICWRRGC